MLRQRCIKPFGCSRPGLPAQPVRPGLWARSSRGNATQLRALDKWRNVTTTGNDASMMQLDINGGEGTSSGAIRELPVQGPQLSPQEELTSPTASWESWLKIFEQMDESYQKQEDLKLQLQDAVSREDYSRAAGVKRQLYEVQSLDAVAAVQKELSAALQNEEYSQAAVLRDQGMAWMQGWWSGISENDPVGHLLHISPEFGRYTGRVYTARDLADLSGWQSGSSTLQRLRATLQSDSSTRPRTSSPVGTPSMEVFVVRGSSGELSTQVVSLVGSQPGKTLERGRELKGGDAVDAAAMDGVTSMLGVGPMMKLSIVIGWDGSTSIKATPVKSEDVPVKSKFSSWEAEEAAETLRELASLPPTPTPSAATTSATDDEEDELAATLRELADVGTSNSSKPAVTEAVVDEVIQPPAVPDEDLRVVDSQELSSSEQVLIAEALEGLRSRQAGEKDNVGETLVDIRSGKAVDLDATAPDELSSDEEDVLGLDGSRDTLQSDLHRSPAQVERNSVNQFVLCMSQDVTGAGYAAGDQSVAARSAASAARASADADEAQDGKSAAKFEILMPMGQVARSSGRASAAITVVAERVARAQASRVGQPVDAIALREALQSLMENITGGKPSELTIPGASQQQAAADQSSSATARGQLRCTYNRLNSNATTSDPFNGLYIGAFGPHGPEVLQIRRTQMGGEEAVEAIKVTGDANVPAGTVSFKAKIGRQYKLSGSNVYPDELGVQARYKGQGRVAARGYSKPKWVEGELLVLSSSARLTAGAELGFVWNVPGERKFLILLNKLDLSTLATA